MAKRSDNQNTSPLPLNLTPPQRKPKPEEKPREIKRPPKPAALAPPPMRPIDTSPRNLSPLPQTRSTRAVPPLSSASQPAPKEKIKNDESFFRSAQRSIGQQRPNPNTRPLPKLPPSTRVRHISGPRLGKGAYARKRGRRFRYSLHPIAKRILSYVATISIIAIFGFMVIFRFFSVSAFSVYIDGNRIGYTSFNRETTNESFLNDVLNHLRANESTDIILLQQIEIHPARWVSGNNTLDRNAMLSLLGLRLDYQIRARAIYINGRHEATVRSQECVDEIVRLIMEPSITDYTYNARFLTEWEIVIETIDRNYENILTPLDATRVLDRHEIRDHPHTVQPGEFLETIATRFGVTAESIARLNDIYLNAIIHPGDVLMIRSTQPMLSVETVDRITSYQPIPFETQTRENPDMPESTTEIIQQGIDGEKRVTQEITRINGTQTNTITLDDIVIRTPIDHIVEVGTRQTVIERR